MERAVKFPSAWLKGLLSKIKSGSEVIWRSGRKLIIIFFFFTEEKSL